MPSVDLTPDKLAELKQKAEAASSNSDGRWGVVDNPHTGGWGLCIHDQGDIIARATGRDKKWKISVFNHIAAADPATVLAMVEELTDVRMALLELAWEFYGRDQTREEIESCCAVMVENERASRKESEAGQ